MPSEVQQRFKALKVLYDQVNEIDEEEEKEYRKLELKYEALYQEIYKRRQLLISGESEVDLDLCKQFDVVKEELTDAKYNELEVTPCDVKDI